MSAWVSYLIRCGDLSLYAGSTNDLARRLKQHRAGRGAKYARGRGFLTIAWSEAAADKSSAMRREAQLKKLPKKEKETLVLSQNPLLEAYAQTGPRLSLNKIHELRNRYSWAIPTEEALREIAKLSPVVEMGAGTGYWAGLLNKMGVDIVAYDRSPPGKSESLVAACNLWHHGATAHYEVSVGEPCVLAGHPDRALLLCWPPRGSMALECLNFWRGQHLVFVGDFGHTTADGVFFDAVRSQFTLSACVELPRWPMASDVLTVWSRL